MKKSNKSFIILCIILLLLIGLVNKIFNKETQNNTITNIKKTEPILIFDEREYYSNWNDNVNEDLISIQKILIKNNITGCGEFYYNEIEPKTFIIGCTRDGVNFKYYAVWTRLDKIYSTDSDILTIFPPSK